MQLEKRKNVEAVGIFWFVDGYLVAAGCPIDLAVMYGEVLTYDGGHAEHWELWQKAGAHWLIKHGLPLRILETEYDDHPRGRIVKQQQGFVLYADRRLQNSQHISDICDHFGLDAKKVSVRSDSHYRRNQTAF